MWVFTYVALSWVKSLGHTVLQPSLLDQRRNICQTLSDLPTADYPITGELGDTFPRSLFLVSRVLCIGYMHGKETSADNAVAWERWSHLESSQQSRIGLDPLRLTGSHRRNYSTAVRHEWMMSNTKNSGQQTCHHRLTWAALLRWPQVQSFRGLLSSQLLWPPGFQRAANSMLYVHTGVILKIRDFSC